MRVLILTCGLAATLLLSGCCNPQPLKSLAVPMKAQETAYWCWAAVGEMCMDFLGTDVSQCDQANKRFGRTDCCNSPTPGPCLNGGWPEFAKYNFTFSQTTNTALSWSQLTEQIYCKEKPVAFVWHWDGGGGHIQVARGYATLDSGSYVFVNDPMPTNLGTTRIITYSAYVSGPGYTHWDDFYDITRQ